MKKLRQSNLLKILPDIGHQPAIRISHDAKTEGPPIGGPW